MTLNGVFRLPLGAGSAGGTLPRCQRQSTFAMRDTRENAVAGASSKTAVGARAPARHLVVEANGLFGVSANWTVRTCCADPPVAALCYLHLHEMASVAVNMLERGQGVLLNAGVERDFRISFEQPTLSCPCVQMQSAARGMSPPPYYSAVLAGDYINRNAQERASADFPGD